MKRFWVLVFVIALMTVLLIAGVALASGSASSYDIPWDAYSSGGEHNMTSSNYTMFSTAGQELVGGTSSDSYQLGAGFWTSMTEEEITYELYLPLVLRSY